MAFVSRGAGPGRHVKTAIVTGGANGIGRATVRRFATSGMNVAVVDQTFDDRAELESEVAGLGGRATLVEADVSDPEAVHRAVEEVVGRFTSVDILVNNAGVSCAGKLTAISTELWDRTHAINLRAPFLFIQHLAPQFMAQRSGKIVTVTSSSAFRALNSNVAYGTSKIGILALTRAVAAELGPFGVNVNAVAPGLTATPMTSPIFSDEGALDRAVREGPLANLLHRPSTAEDVASIIAFLCDDASRQITGQVVHASAGAVC